MSTVARKTDRFVLAGTVAIGAALFACFQIANAEEPKYPGAQLQLSEEEASFVDNAAKGGNAEVLEAKLAQEKTANEKVRAAAEQLEKDHAAANEKLRKIVASRGARLPKEPAEERKAVMEQLKEKEGRAFDQHYLRGQVEAHRKSIEMFEKQAKEGKNPQLRAFANAQLPTLRHHLEMMQELERTHTASK